MTLDNYIMESEINDATVGDIYVEQALAEMEVAYALASSYTKDAMFVEYMADLYGVDVFQEGYYFQEADGDEKEKKSIKERFNSFKDRVADAPSRFWEFLKSVASGIVTALTNFWHFITEKSLKSCIKKLENTQLELTYDVKANLKDNLGLLIGTTESFIKALEAFSESDDNYFGVETNEFDKSMKSLSTDPAVVKMTAEELLEMFKDLQDSDIPKRIKASIKDFKQFIKYCDKAVKNKRSEYEDAKEGKKRYKATKKLNSEAMRNVKNKGAFIIKAYSQLVREFRAVANRVLKDERALQKAYVKRGKSNEKTNKAYNKAMTKLGISRDDDSDRINGYKTKKDKPNNNKPKDDVPKEFTYKDPYDDYSDEELGNK